MSRKSQKKSVPLQPGELLDKRIADLGIQISESRQKLDKYIDAINSKIGNVISSQMNRLAVAHKQIVEQKEQEIKSLELSTEQFKETVLCQHVKQLEATLKQCKEDIVRITKVLQIFRKESEKARIQLDIRDKQLFSCKKRQKNLIKQLWVLQENIKDIYSYEFVTNDPRQSPNSHAHRTSTSFVSKPDESATKLTHKRRQYTALHTEQPSKPNSPSLKIMIDDQSVGSRASIYDATNLLQKLKNIPKRYGQKSVRSNSEFKVLKPGTLSQRSQQYKIYEDLRHSIRKVDRIELQQPKYLQHEDKLISKQQFQMIALNAPKIMKMIERVVIQQYGQLKQIDECSTSLLNRLFQNQNAVKILQIMLFNYSIEAIREIKQNKSALAHENYYSQPAGGPGQLQEQTPVLSYPKKLAVDTSIRRNFKNQYHQPLLNKAAKDTAK